MPIWYIDPCKNLLADSQSDMMARIGGGLGSATHHVMPRPAHRAMWQMAAMDGGRGQNDERPGPRVEIQYDSFGPKNGPNIAPKNGRKCHSKRIY